MQITLQADVLNHIINIVAKASRQKATGVGTDNIIIKVSKQTIEFIGTDLEIQAIARLPYKAEKTGEVAVPAQSFSQYIATLDESDKVTLSVEKGYLNVETSGGKAKFNIAEVKDLTHFDVSKLKLFAQIRIQEISEVIRKTVFSALKGDDTRPVLTGVFFDGSSKKLTTVALDTFRMSVYNTNVAVEDAHSFVVTYRALQLLDKVIKDSFLANVLGAEQVEILVNNDLSLVAFKFGEIIIFVKTIEGTYPDYKSIIPKDFKIQGEVDTQSFAKALRRVGVFAQNSLTKEIVFELLQDKIKLFSRAQENGESTQEIQASFDGDQLPLKVGFQFRFLQEFLSSIDSESIEIKLNDAMSPVVFLSKGNKKFLHIIMPLKL